MIAWAEWSLVGSFSQRSLPTDGALPPSFAFLLAALIHYRVEVLSVHIVTGSMQPTPHLEQTSASWSNDENGWMLWSHQRLFLG